MSKYLLLYRGPATPMANMSEAQGKAQMQAWDTWMGRCGPALTDVGMPFGDCSAVGDDGKIQKTDDLHGYSIVEADDLASATAMTQQHPFLSEGKGRFSVEVFELLPVPM